MTSLESPAPQRPTNEGDAPSGEAAHLGEDWLEAGLTAQQVDERLRATPPAPPPGTSQSFGFILRRNTFTRLNLLLVMLGAATLVSGSAPDATFLIIAVVNTVIGTVQEVRAKRTLDALAVINAPHARVIRDAATREILPEEVLVDDLLDLRPGDQITADAVVVADSADVDESLATGESDPVTKSSGDRLISGSWVVAGSVRARVLTAGSDSYASRLAEEARRFSLTSSELMSGINRVLRALSWLMVAIAPVLFVRQLQAEPWRLAIRSAVAGLVGMIPEGLVLLTTLAFLAAALRLSRRRVLVQELPAVETLARVDALCVDKTGTLTEGRITFGQLRTGSADRPEVENALAALSSARGANATMLAIRGAISATEAWKATAEVPFSSERKWSGATFDHRGTWVMGAPELIGGADPDALMPSAAQAAAAGRRVLVVARSPGVLGGKTLPADLTIVAIVELAERTRPSVRQTLAYFDRQDVTVRVISGDSPVTVRSVAEEVGLPEAAQAVDARSLPSDPQAFAAEIERRRVFGRVTPEDKRRMVTALQEGGHTVAMTGDGVNDVLALKQADLGIAMGSGSAITRGVAQIVDLADDFDVLPSVVAEGRRVLSNVERVASLFLVKNVYSLLLSVTTSVTGWPYPFLPRHLTLISAVGIGIPGVFLALAPSERRFRPGFLRRVLAFSVMAGTLTAAAVIGTYGLARSQGVTGDTARTSAIIVTVVVTLWVLLIAARPLTPLRLLLVAAMGGLFVAAFFLPGVNTFFSLQHRPGASMLVQSLAIGGAAAVAIDVLVRLPPVRRLTAVEHSR